MTTQADAPTVSVKETSTGYRYKAVTPLPEHLTDYLGVTEVELTADWNRETDAIRATVYGVVEVHLPTVNHLGNGAAERAVSHEFAGLLKDMGAHGDAWATCLASIIHFHQETNQ